MVNVDCAGGQDRHTTTSETHSEIPPSRTENCYTTGEGEANFDWELCGTSGDKACHGKGGKDACIPDNQGGYCKDGDNYYEASGSDFAHLSPDKLLDRYSREGNTDETGREVRRALNDQERRFTNRIRELQIMGKDPIVQRGNKKNDKNDDKNDDKEVHSFIGDMLFNVGIGISFIIFIISVCIILIQNKVI